MSPARKAPEGAAPSPAPLPGAGLGQVAYEAYLDAMGRDKAADWDALVRDENDVAAAWCVAAQAVITATISRKD